MNAVVEKADVVARAKRVGALARKHAHESEELGKLVDPVAEALHSEGLLGMWVPRTLRGGLELDPVTSLEVIENVSYGDPSAGWVLMAASLAIGTGAAYLKDEAVKELFGGSRLPVIAGQGTVGLEILEDAPDAEVVGVPVGGGGLVAGIATAVTPRGAVLVGIVALRFPQAHLDREV